MAEAHVIHTKDLRGTRVVGGKKGTTHIGKVSRFVFHPTQRRCVGFLVRRPDAALMFKRKDLFIPLDSYEMDDGRVRIPYKRKGAEGEGACERLGIDWDACALWEDMPILVEGTEEQLGTVRDVAFSEGSGDVLSVVVNRGATDRALLGEVTLPASMVAGVKVGMGKGLVAPDADAAADLEAEQMRLAGALLVSAEALRVSPEGGIAEAAGAQAAVAKDKVRQATAEARPKVKKAVKQTEAAADKGAYALGKRVGELGRAFGDFKREYDKAKDGNDA